VVGRTLLPRKLGLTFCRFYGACLWKLTVLLLSLSALVLLTTSRLLLRFFRGFFPLALLFFHECERGKSSVFVLVLLLEFVCLFAQLQLLSLPLQLLFDRLFLF